MNRISSALLCAALTASLMTAAACVSELEDSSIDPAEPVGTDSEPLVLGDPVQGPVLQHRELTPVGKEKGAEQNLIFSSYSASNTNSATVNTANYNIILNAGETFTIGTCGVAGATSSGDTYLRLRGPSGVEVASSDDACGAASKITYVATTSGNYQLRAGCYSNNFCSGTLGYSIAATLFAYSASNTNYDTVNTANVYLNIGSFSTLRIGTCGVAGSAGSGDTILRLYNGNGSQVAFNDDSCGVLSQLVFNNSSLPPGTYLLRAGCFNNTSCSGTVAYYIE